MIEPCQQAKPIHPQSFRGGYVLQEGEGGALGRRLITLLFADWVPHDIVFVAEVPLSLSGRGPYSLPKQFARVFLTVAAPFSLPANLLVNLIP